MANRQKHAADNIETKASLTNPLTVEQAKENAATSAKVSGATDLEKYDISPLHNAHNRGKNAMSKYGKDAHKRASKVLGYALTLDTPNGWRGFQQVIAARLTKQERTAIAFMALASLDPDDAALTASAALYRASGEVAV